MRIVNLLVLMTVLLFLSSCQTQDDELLLEECIESDCESFTSFDYSTDESDLIISLNNHYKNWDISQAKVFYQSQILIFSFMLHDSLNISSLEKNTTHASTYFELASEYHGNQVTTYRFNSTYENAKLKCLYRDEQIYYYLELFSEDTDFINTFNDNQALIAEIKNLNTNNFYILFTHGELPHSQDFLELSLIVDDHYLSVIQSNSAVAQDLKILIEQEFPNYDITYD